MSVTQAIRAASAELHTAIERTDFSEAMIRGGLDAESYCTSLTQMWHIHAALERAQTQPILAKFFAPEMTRTPAIERDLAHWSYPLRGSDVFSVTKSIVTRMADLATRQPIALTAYIYVLEGSRMGSMILAKPLAASLGVLPIDGRGIDYHTEGMRLTPARFSAFKGLLDANVTAQEDKDIVCQAAVDFMQALLELYGQLPSGSGAVAFADRVEVA